MKQKIFKGDLVIWTIFFLLSSVSLIEVYSAGSQLVYGQANFLSTFIKQAGFLIGATVMAVFVHHIPCRYFKLFALVGYAVSVVFLVWALFGGTTSTAVRAGLPSP